MVSLDIDALRMIASGNLGGAREHMDKRLEKQRQRDIKEWIEDNVDLTVYEHEALDPEKAAELLDAVRVQLARKDNDIDDPVVILEDKLFDYFVEVYSDWQTEVEHESAEKLSKTFGIPYDEAQDWISTYANVSYPIDDYLKDTYKTVIMLDTGDSNYDFSLNRVEPAYNGDPIEDISEEASLVWLAEQNGYPMEEFIRLMQMKASDELPAQAHPFIHSVYREIENTSSSLNGVAFIGKMSLADLAKAQKEGATVPKRTPCGLYDGINGAGGLLEVELQKDIVIPAEVTFSILPDSSFRLPCLVDQTYGFTHKMWETPLFAGEAKAYEPEQLERAKALCEIPPHIPAEEGTPLHDMQKKFAGAFRSEMSAMGESFYEGMLDRGQFAEAGARALHIMPMRTYMERREEYKFSEKYFYELLKIAPEIPKERLEAQIKGLEAARKRQNGR